MIWVERLPSPMGPFGLAGRGETVVGATFHGQRAAPFDWLAPRFPGEALEERAPASRAAATLTAYFDDPDTDLSGLALELRGGAFERRVWDALRDIPCGELVSYGWIARRLGEPNAAQAVGRANGANPIPVIVPCHRVVGQDGSLTGFGGGLQRKAWLLAHERGGRLL